MPKMLKILSLQYLGNISRKVRDKFDFFHEDKHQSFLQVDTIVCGGLSQASQSTQNKFAYIFNIPRKKGEIDFLHADKHKSFLQVDTINFSW